MMPPGPIEQNGGTVAGWPFVEMGSANVEKSGRSFTERDRSVANGQPEETDFRTSLESDRSLKFDGRQNRGEDVVSILSAVVCVVVLVVADA